MTRTPVWRAIAEALKTDISEGRYRPGDKLPTEAALATRFGVNRHTVRHGLSALIEAGVVRTRRGAGAFVAAAPTDYPIGKRVRFSENLLAAGRRPEREVLGAETRAATEGEAQALRIAPGAQVHSVHAKSLADGQPIALSNSLFPVERLPGIEDQVGQGIGVTEALRAVGVADYTRASTRITALRADATQALHLHLSEGDPILRTTSVNVGSDGRPVQFGRTWFAGDRVTLTLED